MSNISPPDDLEIVRAQKQDLQALEKVLRITAPYVFSLCKTWCRPPIDPEDITQESLLRLGRNIASFQHNSAFFSWVYTLTYRTFLDRARLESRRSKIAKISSVEETPHLEKTIQQEEKNDFQDLSMVSQALELLESIHSDVLILIDVQGNSYENVALELGIPVGTVRSRLSRARLNLRKILIEQGTFDAAGNVLPSKEQL